MSKILPPDGRSVLRGEVSQATVCCIRHRSLRLAHPRSADGGCWKCSERWCRYCGAIRRWSGRREAPPPGVCDRPACRAKATRDERRKSERGAILPFQEAKR